MSVNMKYTNFYNELSNLPELKQSLEKGTIPLLHNSNHNFRDRVKSAELSKKGGIYVQKFLPAKQRAQQVQDKFKEIHLIEEEFDENLPHKNYNHWLKVRDIPIEGPPFRFGKNSRTENERIVKHLQTGDGFWIDHSRMDTKMIYNPEWKPVQKNKWMDQSGIDSNTCMSQAPRNEPPWEEYPLRYDHLSMEYVDSLEKIGEQIYRSRDKIQEQGKPEFISTVQNDSLGQRQHISQSLRTKKCHQALGLDQFEQEYSKKSNLNYYKPALISTKSVDYQIPYSHSQNIRSMSFKDLVPMSSKIYKLSIKYLSDNEKSSPDISNSHAISPTGEGDTKYSSFKEASKSQMLAKQIGLPKSQRTRKDSTKQTSTKQDMHSQRTTQNTWNINSRINTANLPQGKKRHTKLQISTAKEKLNLDPYYQPSNKEAKELVSQYFY